MEAIQIAYKPKLKYELFASDWFLNVSGQYERCKKFCVIQRNKAHTKISSLKLINRNNLGSHKQCSWKNKAKTNSSQN